MLFAGFTNFQNSGLKKRLDFTITMFFAFSLLELKKNEGYGN